TNLGATVTFNVGASGVGPLTFQWRKNGTNLSGATSSSLTLVNIQTNSAAYYSVLVANSAGYVISSNALLTILTPPTITAQPKNVTTNLGATVTFKVTATG